MSSFFADVDVDAMLADIDIGTETRYREVDIKGLAKIAVSPKREFFRIESGNEQLKALLGDIQQDIVYTLLSVKGGFSSINFINYVASQEQIVELVASTLRVGRKEIEHLDTLGIQDALFLVGSIFTDDSKMDDAYGYKHRFIEICEKNGWRYISARNHSKVILMQTEKSYYVLETSANLNENPSIEQFSFTQDKGLYDFYYKFFSEIENAS